MTKAELLDDLASRFTAILLTEEVPNGTNPRWYRSVVFETTVVDDVPLGNRREVHFYVLNEGLESEQAFYMRSVPTNTLESNVIPEV